MPNRNGNIRSRVGGTQPMSVSTPFSSTCSLKNSTKVISGNRPTRLMKV